MKRFTINEFIKYTQDNKYKYINYCEIIIDPVGYVIIASPSHTEAIVEYVMQKENKTKQEINDEIPLYCLSLEWCVDKYGLIAIWHNGYMYSSHKRCPNRFQQKSIDILHKHGLITFDYVRPATVYTNYLYRKSLGLDH